MGKKLNLPLFSDPASVLKPLDRSALERRPSLDAARARLGGRISELDAPVEGFAPGVVVTFSRGASTDRGAGVVVFASKSEVHVLLDGVRLRRLPPAALSVQVAGGSDTELEKLAGDARVFGQLVEGQPVRYSDAAGAMIDGTVVEKCRWGALVLRGDGAIVAVGFRKLWPSRAGGDA